MKLAEYLEKNRISYARASRELGVGHGSVVRRWSLSKGEKWAVMPSHKNMQKIAEWSQGEVAIMDWFA
tara:strand:- start:26 stop:229 length:204 start_codon:yes stop_codon:yes gene_type:complete